MSHDVNLPHAMTLPELKEAALSVANELRAVPSTPGSRERFIHVRAALFQRGIYDPVLVRFDSATVARATSGEIADQLATVAESL